MVSAEDDVKLCVIDVRLGTDEGHAEEQVLGAWSSCQERNPTALMDIARLARGSIGLCSHFSKEPLCTSVAFEQHTVVMVETEPSLFWIIYAQSTYITFPISTERAKACLRSMNNLFRLMYLSLAYVIQSQGYLAARGAIKDFLSTFMPGFCKQEGWCTLHDLYTPMTEHRGLPFIPLKDPGFQGLQAIAAALSATSLVQERPSRGCMISFKQTLLHTTFSAEDASALYLFASRNVIPLTRAENKTTRPFQRLYAGVTDWGKRAGAILNPASWSIASTPEHLGFLFCEQRSTQLEAGTSTAGGGCPELYLEHGEPVRLVVWQQQGFMVRLLDPALVHAVQYQDDLFACTLCSDAQEKPTGDPLRQECGLCMPRLPMWHQVLLAVAGEQNIHMGEFELIRTQFVRLLADVERQLSPLLPSPRQGLISAISAEVRLHEKGHIQGHRYTLTDSASEVPICASTPLPKLMSATSHTCQAVLSLAWQDCQQHMAADAARLSRQHPQYMQDPAGPNTAAAEAGCSGAAESTEQESTENSATEGGDKVQADAKTGEDSLRGSDVPKGSRMEMLAQAPNRKWVQARWSLCSELLHVDDVSSKDTNSLASANRNVQNMLSTYFPGVLGL